MSGGFRAPRKPRGGGSDLQSACVAKLCAYLDAVKRLPPFFALRALEAAARHRSYSRAAEELAVTHGAVSQQIRKLEAELGGRLFGRLGNAMIPRPEAERLAAEVGRAMAILQAAVDDFNLAAECDPLVVSLETQFAARWLPPRLERLLADPAGDNINLLPDDRVADLATDGVDMAIRYGAGGWEGLETACLFTETIIPVCSPKLLAAYPVKHWHDLRDAPLVHHRSRSWSMWFETFGLTGPAIRGPVFDDSGLQVEAAIRGLGFALVRSSLVEAEIASGRLVRPLEGAVASKFGYFVVWRADSRKLARIRALRDWLVAEARGAGGEAPAAA